MTTGSADMLSVLRYERAHAHTHTDTHVFAFMCIYVDPHRSRVHVHVYISYISVYQDSKLLKKYILTLCPDKIGIPRSWLEISVFGVLWQDMEAHGNPAPTRARAATVFLHLQLSHPRAFTPSLHQHPHHSSGLEVPPSV